MVSVADVEVPGLTPEAQMVSVASVEVPQGLSTVQLSSVKTREINDARTVGQFTSVLVDLNSSSYPRLSEHPQRPSFVLLGQIKRRIGVSARAYLEKVLNVVVMQ